MRIGQVLPRAGGDYRIGVRSQLVDGDAIRDWSRNCSWEP